MKITMSVNGKPVSIAADDPKMPLLYALRDDLGLHGPRFGCGLGQCGACTVHRRWQGDALVRDAGCHAGRQESRDARRSWIAGKLHPLQQAFIDEQAVQCGYCINGMIMQAAALLLTNKTPTEQEIKDGACREPVPLRHASAHRARGQARVRDDGLRRMP